MKNNLVGTLLPEQCTFFTNNRDLGDIVDWADDFYAPFHLYIDGAYKQELDMTWDEASDIAREVRDADGGRMVLLDNLGQVVQEPEENSLITGQFHLVYAIESRDCPYLWEFFEDVRPDLENTDDSGTSVKTISAGELANTIFDDEDFFINDAPHQPGLHTTLREYILNLQQIAKLYPLLEIKLYLV